jgi:hypothetical protein
MRHWKRRQRREECDRMTGRVFTVHVGRVRLEYSESSVLASRILEEANFKPAEEFVLEALRGEHGPAEREYQPGDVVDLTNKDSHHFRAVPRGGGRA